MAETFGSNRGITPSISKGIKRNNIRYNINDRIDEDYVGDKKGKKNYQAMTRTRVADIAYYLGEDWVDWKVVRNSGGNEISSSRNILTTSKPLRCTKCNRAFETKAPISGTRLSNGILPSDIFARVPLNRGECGMCDG